MDLKTGHTMSAPKVSILVSCYNHEAYIEACLQSILQQTYKNIELIVVDDGSADNSFDIIKRLASQYNFYAEKQDNMGLSRALNKMLPMTTGKYICQFGSDDIMLPDKTAIQVAFMESNPDVAVCGGNAFLIDKEGDRIYKRECFPPFRDILFDDLFLRRKHKNIFASTGMIRKNILDTLGGWNPSIPLEDMYMWLKITHHGHHMVGLQDVLTLYRKHPDNTYKNTRYMYESLYRTLFEYRANPQYGRVLMDLRISFFLAASKNDPVLAKEILCDIPITSYNIKVLRGMLKMAASYSRLRNVFSNLLDPYKKIKGL